MDKHFKAQAMVAAILSLLVVSSVQSAERRLPPPIRPIQMNPQAKSRGAEQAVDLDALSAPSRPSSPSPSTTSTKTLSPHSVGGGTLPNFKFYYDFLLRSWKGGTSDLSFENYHQKFLVEFTPSPDFMFQAELLSGSYYEADYMVSKSVQLRWGKIWIPFDDMSPHNIFGGRLNTSKFFQANETAFLPDIWADLGLGLKWTIVDSSYFTSIFHIYIVNGFGTGGTSPVSGEGSTGTNVAYPNFGTTGVTDNNNDKSFGGRLAFGIGPKFGFGTSIYNGAYTEKGITPTQSIQMLGVDAQFRPTSSTEIRLGIVTMKVGLNGASKASFTRGGSYVELGQRLGRDDRWKFLLRAGKAQNDNRVVDVSDKTLVGATLLKNFGNFEGQLTYYKDMNKVPSKTAYNYAGLRLVTAF